MAKKKKKATCKSTSESSSPVLTKVQESEASSALPDEVCEFLELKVRRPASKAMATKLGPDSSAPNISLHDSDARKLGVQYKNEVLVCFRDKESATALMKGALICRVDTSSDDTTKSRSAISPGCCQIHPASLVDAILEDEEDNLASTNHPLTPNEASTPSPVVKTPPPSQPLQSPPKSGFSFASGGGGEAYTSPSLATTPTTKSIATAKPPMSAWVIPLSSPLGEDAANVLCQEASQVQIRVLDVTAASLLSRYKHVLTRLFLAQCCGKHIHESEKVTISFQGKALELQICSLEGETKGSQRNEALMELEMESLSLEESNGPPSMETQLRKSIRDALDDPSKAHRVLLYEIWNETKVDFLDENILSKQAQNAPEDHSESPKTVVVGLSTLLERLRALLLTTLLKPELFSGGSLKAPRGVLLTGNSGVGKSCLARQLAIDLQKEEAANIRVEFVSCASLQSYSSQVGEAERRLSQIFEKASSLELHEKAGKKGGTLLVFDDIHLICPKRSGYSPGSDRLAATLLGLLDGIGNSSFASSNRQSASVEGAISSSIVILAVTNSPSLLDPAVRRPGRLDYEIEVPIPDEASTRAEILEFHLQELGKNSRIPHFTDAELLSLGKLAKGFNGADCMLSVKEALRVAFLRQQSETRPSNSQGQVTLVDLQHAIRATKPSAIKSITVEIPKVHWSSIGGMETVKRELREAIELPMSHGHLFKQLQIPPPRGILLYGPPGCSKTLMARALATEGQMNFLAVKGPELLSKWLGESERALASLFRRARMASPSVIFFDEIDSIGGKRGSGGIGSGGGRLLSQLLTELDGVNHTGGIAIGSSLKKNPRVVVVGATNRPDLLDTALMRPGRIDRKIYVGVPDLQSRAQIFKIGLEGKSRAKDVDIGELAKDDISGGFSGAELIAACRDAALLALEEYDSDAPGSDPRIEMHHLMKAVGGMQRQISPEMIQFYDSFRKNQD